MKPVKHSFKRYLAFLLVFVLVMSNSSFTVHAEDPASASDSEINNTLENTPSYPASDASSDLETFKEGNADPSAEQSLGDDLVGKAPEDSASHDQEPDVSNVSSENQDKGTDEDITVNMSEAVNLSAPSLLASDRSSSGTVTVTLRHDPGGFDYAVMTGEAQIVMDYDEGHPIFESCGVDCGVPVDPGTESCIIENDTEAEFSVRVELKFDEVSNQLQIDRASIADKHDAVEVTVRADTSSYIQYYTVTVGSTQNGKVSVDGETVSIIGNKMLASQEQMIYLDVDPDDYYVLDSISAGNAQGGVIQDSESDNRYYFEMPAENVTVAASFSFTGLQATYLDLDGTLKTESCTPINSSSNTWAPGWYAVQENTTFDQPITVYGNVNLILMDGKELAAPFGINIPAGSSLTVWWQSGRSGKLTVPARNTQNCISGAGAITINGGVVEVTNENGGGGIACSSVTINGGQITAQGNPGIGTSQGTVVLNYTNSGDRITATTYAGTVTLKKFFSDTNGGSYQAGTVSANGMLYGRTLKPGPHNYSKVAKNVPTFDAETGEYTNGNIEYYFCSDCNSYFTYNSAANTYTEIDASEITLPYFTIDDDGTSVQVIKYNGTDPVITVPDTVPSNYPDESLCGRTITSVHSSAFRNNTTIRKVTMGDNITQIGEEAFRNASNLEEVMVGSGLNVIDAYAFYDTPKLTKFTCTNTENEISVPQSPFDTSSSLTFYGMHEGAFRDAFDSSFAVSDAAFEYIGIDEHTVTWTWAEDYSTCTAQFCSICGLNITLDASVSAAEAPDQSYDTPSETIYTASVTYEGIQYTDEQTVVISAGSGTKTDPYIISDAADWDALAEDIEEGINADKCFKLADGFSDTVTVPIGTKNHPFAGDFDGNGQTLDVSIVVDSDGAAPFQYIADASIHDLTVTGSVNGDWHSAGLVCFNWSGSSIIENCTVSADVTASYIGGVVGHGKSAVLTLKNVVFNGVLHGHSFVGGLVGWNDNSTLTFDNCLFAGTEKDNSSVLVFRPVTLKDGNSTVTIAGIQNVYYTQGPKGESEYENFVEDAAGQFVQKSRPDGICRSVTAADGNKYYCSAVTLSGLKEYYTLSGVSSRSYTLTDESGYELVEDTDYTVSMAPAEITGEGSYTLTFTGKGKYEGTTSFTFHVDNRVGDVLNRNFTGVGSTTIYTNWSGKNGVSGAVYAGNSAGDHNAIQLRSNNNNSGIVSTVSGGLVSNVSVKWNDYTTADRILQIYGRNTPYESPADLYDSDKQGTLLGTIVYGGDNATELTITGDYAYVGLRSASGALYLNEVTILWSEQEPEFKGHSILLTGQIGLQFFLELPAGKTAADYPGSYVTFEGNKADSTKQHALPASTFGSSGRYLFQLELSSIQMADKFTPTFHYTVDGEEKTVTGDAYAVKDYIDWALGEGSSSLNTRQQTIIPKLADYGHYAQPYLSRQNGWTIGTSYAEMTTYVTQSYDYDTVKAAAESSAFSRTQDTANIETVNYRLTFGTQITLTVRIKPTQPDEDLEITAEGGSVTKSGQYYMVNYTGIYANQLANQYTITAGDCTISVSPMSYVFEMLNSTTAQKDLKDLVCALYHYAQACKAQ